MQVCDSCGALREQHWQACPFCRAPLVAEALADPDEQTTFDPLAAAAEFTETEVLPSPIAPSEPEEPTEPEDLITAQDLAHLTGTGGPSVSGWDSAPTTQTNPNEEAEEPEADGVPKAVLVPLVAVAVAAVIFVAFSIVTQSSTPRPDRVALLDTTTTTMATTTTEAEWELEQSSTISIGVDIAEQAGRLCSGQQFSIARAAEATVAIHNDLMLSSRDGRNDWVTDPTQEMLRSPVPALLGCLTTADGGEIDRCPTESGIISRRSVEWSYRVLATTDGTVLGADAGTANETQSCDELVARAGGDNFASYSPIPQDRIELVATEYTSNPHPQIACPSAPEISFEPRTSSG